MCLRQAGKETVVRRGRGSVLGFLFRRRQVSIRMLSVSRSQNSTGTNLLFNILRRLHRANSIAVVLVFRFLQGGAGSVGSTLVGGTLADIWPASERGGKMAVFALMAVSGTAFAPVIFSWVEANPSLEWRWIQWIQIILVGVYLPSIPLFMPETRAAVLLKKQAEKMRKKKREEAEGGGKDGEKGVVGVVGGWDQGMKYLARGEVGKPKLTELIRVSLVRPIRECPAIHVFIFPMTHDR